VLGCQNQRLSTIEHLLHEVGIDVGAVEQALAQVLYKHRRRLPVLELPRLRGQVVHPKVHASSACRPNHHCCSSVLLCNAELF
jgi:hypothetical protein